ncbi:MAG: hypothetical protein JXQ72_02270 [Anaerolineae bacterium]|nr:hypothetical protein [Anaerolineae bacterium]
MTDSVSRKLARAALLHTNRALYAGLLRPLIFRQSAQDAHERMIRWLRWADSQAWLLPFVGMVRTLAFRSEAVTVGGVTLEAPLILAAGLVKGDGFDSEAAALDAVSSGRNIIPGWRVLPRLVGAVEFGSFTRWPRLGNPGTVVWRDVDTHSSQNRVGLRNPGARVAAVFLGARKDHLPPVFGINLAVSPGVDDPAEQTREIVESLAFFFEQGIKPDWITLNLSCPNTGDDPGSHQTIDGARLVCGAALDALGDIPLWVKLGPTLADEQYRALMAVFAEIGVRAVVATNTLPMSSPDDPGVQAGVGGGRLHTRAVEVAAALAGEKNVQNYTVDIVGCGGVQDGATYQDFARLGARAVQYWTAMIYRGPLAAALIAGEAGSQDKS